MLLRRIRHDAGLVAALVAGALLRMPWLGALPNPCGDEGNWPLYALRIARGARVDLTADAGFVSLAWARLIATVFRVFGASFATARAVPVGAALLGVAAVYAVSVRRDGRAAATAMAVAVAVHPWSVWWSRTSSVPYALSFALCTVGMLLARDGASWWRAVVAFQCLGMAVQGSPLAALAFATAVLTARGHWRRLAWWAAVSLGALHMVPVAIGALAVPHAARQSMGDAEPLGTRLVDCARMLVGDLSGASTVDHFAGHSAWVTLAVTAALAGVFTRTAAMVRNTNDLRAPAAGVLVAAIGVPLVLLPARSWHMPTIDADRYGFALLAPWVLWLGASARHGARRAVAAQLAVWLALSVGSVWAVHRGAGPDQGMFTRDGGGRYRGWQPLGTGDALVVSVRARVLAETRGAPAVVMYGDYAFHALRFVDEAAGDDRVLHAFGRFDAVPGRRAFALLWAPGVFSATYAPRDVVDAQGSVRALLTARSGARRVETFTLANGTPWVELWALE